MMYRNGEALTPQAPSDSIAQMGQWRPVEVCDIPVDGAQDLGDIKRVVGMQLRGEAHLNVPGEGHGEHQLCTSHRTKTVDTNDEIGRYQGAPAVLGEAVHAALVCHPFKILGVLKNLADVGKPLKVLEQVIVVRLENFLLQPFDSVCG
jgi:hypothetical protein